ncbi:hypothetical protein VMCG_05520 [Cytospora schulzeri]|uniref:Uncharacterized protein n=1 Tax=Cytospora schulzeri TaxID=448051 RepID=A0A423WEY6_9PEZI|nr:hypothetical protein VMCG_05520 [Valsa malicola]
MPDDIAPNILVQRSGKDPPMELSSFTTPQLRKPSPAAGSGSGSLPVYGYESINLNSDMSRLPISDGKIFDVAIPEILLPQDCASQPSLFTTSRVGFLGVNHHYGTRDHGPVANGRDSVLGEPSIETELDLMNRSIVTLSPDGLARVPENISMDASVSVEMEHQLHLVPCLLSSFAATTESSANAITIVHHHCIGIVDIRSSSPSSRCSMCGQESRVDFNKTPRGVSPPSDNSHQGTFTQGIDGVFALSEHTQDRGSLVHSMASVPGFPTLCALAFSLVMKLSQSEQRKLRPWEAGTKEGLLQALTAAVVLLLLQVVAVTMKGTRAGQWTRKYCCLLEDPG